MQTPHQLDENYNADYLDALADLAYQQCQAMMESHQSQWSFIEHDYDPTQETTSETI